MREASSHGTNLGLAAGGSHVQPRNTDRKKFPARKHGPLRPMFYWAKITEKNSQPGCQVVEKFSLLFRYRAKTRPATGQSGNEP